MSTILQEPVPNTAVAMPRDGEPAWDVALLFPSQGNWSEADYLALHTNRMVELANGRLEVLSTPKVFHQLLVKYLAKLFDAYVADRQLGDVLFAPLPVHLFPGTFREPDIVFLQTGRIKDVHAPVQGADLVVEVVSDSDEDRRRDLVIKREEYARAGIAEYWIVDPREKCVLVLALDGGTYRLHGEFRSSDDAVSVLLPEFRVSVGELFAAAQVGGGPS